MGSAYEVSDEDFQLDSESEIQIDLASFWAVQETLVKSVISLFILLILYEYPKVVWRHSLIKDF